MGKALSSSAKSSSASSRHRLSGKSDAEHRMRVKPSSKQSDYRAAGKLKGKVALITGGDSGIGRAVAIALAKEGANISIIYLHNHQDAQETQMLVEQAGRQCLIMSGDVGSDAFCRKAVKQTIQKLKRLDVLVNNAAEHQPQEKLQRITAKQLERTFRTNVYSCFYLTTAALPHLKPGASIINTASVTAYRGSEHLIDYAATKGAVVAFTRSLSKNLVDKGIRVNGVAPGPIWTPLITSSFPPKQVKQFGKKTPMKRPGQPDEVAPCFVFLASEDSSYMTGQFLHPNGGEIVNA